MSWLFFCSILSSDDNGVATRSCNKKLKLPFRNSKLEMQSLLYVGPSNWNKLLSNLKIATNVNCFKYALNAFLRN